MSKRVLEQLRARVAELEAKVGELSRAMFQAGVMHSQLRASLAQHREALEEAESVLASSTLDVEALGIVRAALSDPHGTKAGELAKAMDECVAAAADWLDLLDNAEPDEVCNSRFRLALAALETLRNTGDEA